MKQTTNYFAVLSLDDVGEGEEEVEVEDITPSADDAPKPSPSPLIEKTPAELRLKIFGLVLQAQYSVVNVSHLPPHKRGRKFNTALFAVSRTISAEAEESFYKLNIIRVKSLNDPYLTRSLTQHVELAGDVVQRFFLWFGPSSVSALVNIYKSLPKIKSVALASDFVFNGPLPQLRRPGTLVPGDKAIKREGFEFRVTAYGVHEAYPVRAVGFDLKRFDFIDAVAYAKRLDPTMSLQALDEQYEASKHQHDPRQVVRTLFALRVTCFETWRTKQAGATIEESEQEIVDKNFWMTPQAQAEVDSLLEQIPSTTRLLDLTAEEHGHEVLKLANDVVGDQLPPWPKKA